MLRWLVMCRRALIRHIIIVHISVMSVCSIAYAQNAPCSSLQANRALTQADTLRTWDALYKSYAAYRTCDDGAIAEGYSESVARILVDHWETLPRLIALTKSDPRFRKFVLRHIDASDDVTDLQKIKLNSTKHCAAEFSGTCASIERVAEAAIHDSSN
jgi:hypothetical protein